MRLVSTSLLPCIKFHSSKDRMRARALCAPIRSNPGLPGAYRMWAACWSRPTKRIWLIRQNINASLRTIVIATIVIGSKSTADSRATGRAIKLELRSLTWKGDTDSGRVDVRLCRFRYRAA